ncbi:MAG: NAD-dependent protein deacylase [Burkholderiales bacterium]|jgi:NAD-dependent deacetylase|nr:NAD-dependent protein deacylase [Burkholderiales bacterium]
MDSLKHMRERLSRSRHVVALTGAGMSQESGLPTFRDATDGLWNQYVASEVATAEALRANPQKVWLWLRELVHEMSKAMPSAGHLALGQLEQRCKVTVVTQNVDDLHERAASTDVIHLHGNAYAYRCMDCTRPMVMPAGAIPEWKTLTQTMRCSHCGGLIRHDVVLFNEAVDATRMAQARSAIEAADVVLVIGTSGLIYPAATLPQYASDLHKYVVEINPDDTPISAVVPARIKGMAAASLVELLSDDGLPFAGRASQPALYQEHASVALLYALPEFGLASGTVGVIVHCHVGGTSFEFEFMSPDGRTIGVATLHGDDLRPLNAGE